MVCPLRYILFAASAAVALITLWLTCYETEKDSEFDGMSSWQIFKEFMTGGYLWQKYKDWRDSKKEKPCADLGQGEEQAKKQQ
mmetsp:Transcript_23739/g.44339  ORF Transcript_23739/g.44339 Transcript_23739/m.44339 type:complete len:83 (+) Transcript_23739:94-342(+)